MFLKWFNGKICTTQYLLVPSNETERQECKRTNTHSCQTKAALTQCVVADQELRTWRNKKKYRTE